MSRYGNLLNLDFNTVRTLRMVFRLGSFSDAADALGVKQSTVSYTVDRLRNALGDPLMVRQGGKNVPTERCKELMPVIDRLLAEADKIENPGEFDPAKAHAEVAIVSAATTTSVLMPLLFRRVYAEAPGIELNLNVGVQDVATPVLEGRADLAVVYNDLEENGLYSMKGLDTDFPVCIMDINNPWVGKTLTIEDLSQAKHVGARLWSGWRQPYAVAAEKRGAKINEVLTVNEQLSVPNLIRGTDLIGGMPSKMARSLGDQIGIAYFPFELKLSMNMYWSAASNRSPLNQWLRQIVVEEAKKL